MKSRGWASLLLAAFMGLWALPVDAAYTRIDTGLLAIESALLQAPPPAVAEIPADAWIVESIIPLGTTADGQPLALISLLVPNSSLDELPPASTRAGPYAAPKTHTRVFCIVQPPLGLYSVGGHYYTVLVVSLAAGYSMDEAKELAFFAQYPDYVAEYEAWDLWEGDRSASRIAAHKSKEWAKVGKSLSENALLKQSIGHSFRNSDPVPYRKSYAQNWSSLGGLHEKGMVLHFFADLYAHAYDQADGTERLVNTGLGHATKGTGPDYIGRDHAKYEKYVRDMYAMIKKDGSNDGMIEGLLAFTKTFSVPNKHRTYYSYDASAGKLSAESIRFFDGAKENDSMRAFAQMTLARRGSKLPGFDPSDTMTHSRVLRGSAEHYGIRNHNHLLNEEVYILLLQKVEGWGR